MCLFVIMVHFLFVCWSLRISNTNSSEFNVFYKFISMKLIIHLLLACESQSFTTKLSHIAFLAIVFLFQPEFSVLLRPFSMKNVPDKCMV